MTTIAPKVWTEEAPDLAIEVLSPSKPRKHEKIKIAAYLENDTALAWLIDAVLQSVTVYVPGVPPRVFPTTDTLTGDSLLPGLAIPVADIFEDVNAG